MQAAIRRRRAVLQCAASGLQNGFKAYMSLCQQTRAVSLLAFNSETRPTVTGPDNLLAPESKIARGVLNLFQSILAR